MTPIDTDTLEAIVTLWSKTKELLTLTAGRPPETGTLKTNGKRALPYAQILCEFAKSERTTKCVKDVRKVTIVLRGLRSQVDELLKVCSQTFGSRMGAEKPPLVYPSGAAFAGWRTTNNWVVTQEDTASAGQDVWRAECQAEVISGRLE